MSYFTRETGSGYTEPRFGRIIGWGVTGLISLGLFLMSFTTVDMGYTTIYQNTFTGKSKIYHGPDFIIKPPFISNVTVYKDDTTLSFATDDGDGATSEKPPINVSFADTYKAKLIINARMVLPIADEKMFKLHKSFRSHRNLVSSLYTKTMVDVAVNTATQFTAEEIFQGGLNSLKSAIEDQANQGVYVTKRTKVLSDSGVTDRTIIGGKKTSSKTSMKAVYVWKAVPKRDKSGNIVRTSNPLTKYGVTVSQVNLAEPIPEPLLEKLLVGKKTLVAKKIASIQTQENAKTDIETAKLVGEAERVKQEQKRLIVADAAVIDKKKEVQLAKQTALREIVERQKVADLAIIDKTKDLQVAVAEFKIQQANAKSAKEKGKAILEVGKAKAEIKKLMYLAVKKDILELEVTRVTQLAKYKALGTAKITMPQTVMMGGKDGSNGLSELTNLHIMDKLK